MVLSLSIAVVSIFGGVAAGACLSTFSIGGVVIIIVSLSVVVTVVLLVSLVQAEKNKMIAANNKAFIDFMNLGVANVMLPFQKLKGFLKCSFYNLLP